MQLDSIFNFAAKEKTNLLNQKNQTGIKKVWFFFTFHTLAICAFLQHRKKASFCFNNENCSLFIISELCCGLSSKNKNVLSVFIWCCTNLSSSICRMIKSDVHLTVVIASLPLFLSYSLHSSLSPFLSYTHKLSLSLSKTWLKSWGKLFK